MYMYLYLQVFVSNKISSREALKISNYIYYVSEMFSIHDCTLVLSFLLFPIIYVLVQYMYNTDSYDTNSFGLYICCKVPTIYSTLHTSTTEINLAT